jgi:hypothetical protein
VKVALGCAGRARPPPTRVGDRDDRSLTTLREHLAARPSAQLDQPGPVAGRVGVLHDVGGSFVHGVLDLGRGYSRPSA